VKITVLNYGMGNLRSVQRALETTGASVEVTDDPATVRKAEKIVLPGVGAFGEAARRIRSLGLWDAILEKGIRGTPLLGICLGMQLLFESSEEDWSEPGLGILPGKICRFDNKGVKVPHIGWNQVHIVTSAGVLTRAIDSHTFYFVHSFYLPDSSWATGRTTYGTDFVSAIERDNVLGVQFHPEKSQDVGLELLNNFVRW